MKREGVLSLWKGNLVTIIHRLPYSAVNFATYELANQHLRPWVPNDVTRRLVAGGLSGLVACTAVGAGGAAGSLQGGRLGGRWVRWRRRLGRACLGVSSCPHK